MPDMEYEGRAADDRRVDEIRRNPEILAEIEARGTALGGGAEQAVDVLEAEAAIVESPGDPLRHQIDHVEPRADLAEIALGRADDRRAAALKAAHH